MSDALEHPMRAWGLVSEAELSRVLVVSPHLDDAVLSCGELVHAHPGVVVATVFAGNPEAYPQPQREWDRQCGFAPGDDVMAARRVEDHAALAVLGATALHLPFVEYSYNPGDVPERPESIATALVEVLHEHDPTAVFVPFGLANPDHDVTHRASLLALDALRDAGSAVPWFAYEDYRYKHIPGMLAWRIAQLFRAKRWPTPVCPPLDLVESRKADALACYPSQLRALDDDWRVAAKLAAPAPEQYWRLAPPPPGWEGLAE